MMKNERFPERDEISKKTKAEILDEYDAALAVIAVLKSDKAILQESVKKERFRCVTRQSKYNVAMDKLGDKIVELENAQTQLDVMERRFQDASASIKRINKGFKKRNFEYTSLLEFIHRVCREFVRSSVTMQEYKELIATLLHQLLLCGETSVALGSAYNNEDLDKEREISKQVGDKMSRLLQDIEEAWERECERGSKDV